jgi:DNA-binding MarR family transcriptional regulator
MANEAPGTTEFSDGPAVLVLADSEAAGERARRSAERAGCRVSDTVGIAGGVDRIEQQAVMDAVMVEVEQDHGLAFDRLLDRLEEMAGQRRGSVISAPLSLIDAIVARTPNPLIQHLCGATEMERVAAIAFASAREKQSLHDVGREQGQPRLLHLSREVERIAGILAAMAEREGRGDPFGSDGPDTEGAPPIDAAAVRAIIRARRLRDQYFASDLFADPAWDILLDLFAAQLEGRRVAVSSLCIAAAVPPTTALRWIKTLTDLGLLVRAADPQDGRRVHIELGPKAAAGVEAYLQAAQRISPSIL